MAAVMITFHLVVTRCCLVYKFNNVIEKPATSNCPGYGGKCIPPKCLQDYMRLHGVIPKD